MAARNHTSTVATPGPTCDSPHDGILPARLSDLKDVIDSLRLEVQNLTSQLGGVCRPCGPTTNARETGCATPVMAPLTQMAYDLTGAVADQVIAIRGLRERLEV